MPSNINASTVDSASVRSSLTARSEEYHWRPVAVAVSYLTFLLSTAIF